MNVVLREMRADEISMIKQVNRRETIEAKYVASRSPDGMSLSLHRVEMNPPQEAGPWSTEGINRRIGEWRPQVEEGGLLSGAFDGRRLIGFAMLGPKLRDESAELAAIFVDADHRRSGVGSLLMNQVESRAKEMGIRAMYAASNRTASAVEFYLKQAWRIIALADDSIVDPRRARVVFGKEL